MTSKRRENKNLVSLICFSFLTKWLTSLLHSRSDTFSLQNVRFRKQKIMLDTYTRPRGRCFLVSIKKVQNVHFFQEKILATTICHLATEIFYLVAS